MDAQFSRWFQEAKRKTRNKSRVSLDVFDTALLRKVHSPKDIFRMMECDPLLSSQINGFAEWRVQAESDARKFISNPSIKEITLDQIYDQLVVDMPELKPIRLDLINLELEVEKRVSIPNPWVLHFYQWARQEKIIIDFISDIYLPHYFVEALLNQAGYDSKNHLWVSSSFGVTKHSQKLFRQYLLDTNCSPDEILHIGDNFYSDIKQAKRTGLSALHIPKLAKDDCFSKNAAEALVRGIALSQERIPAPPNTDPLFFKIGSAVAGPLITSFVFWLKERLGSNPTDVVFFLARDGEIVKKCFEKIFPNSSFEAKYFYATRRALKFAAIRELNDDSLNFLTSSTINLTVEDVLRRIDLSPSSYGDLFPFENIKSLGENIHSKHIASLKRLLLTLESDILDQARKEREAFNHYLDGLLPKKENFTISLIDVGWDGSIQSSLQTIMNETYPNVEIDGLYLGSFKSTTTSAVNTDKKSGFLCEENHPKSQYLILTSCLEIVETLFSSKEKSCIKFEIDSEGKSRPVFNHRKGESISDKQIDSLQSGIFLFIDSLQSCSDSSIYNQKISPEIASSSLKRLLLHPNREEIEVLGSLYYSDGFGDSPNYRKILNLKSSLHNWIHPYQFLEDFKSSHWKIAFWKGLTLPERIFLRILFPISSKKVIEKLKT